MLQGASKKESGGTAKQVAGLSAKGAQPRVHERGTEAKIQLLYGAKNAMNDESKGQSLKRPRKEARSTMG